MFAVLSQTARLEPFFLRILMVKGVLIVFVFDLFNDPRRFAEENGEKDNA